MLKLWVGERRDGSTWRKEKKVEERIMQVPNSEMRWTGSGRVDGCLLSLWKRRRFTEERGRSRD
jgi:hypothetical protein